MSSVNDYMMEFARGMIGWEDGCDQERLRAIFTTYCLMNGVMAEPDECNHTFETLYNNIENMQELVDYEDFKKYMIRFIV